MSFWPRTVSDPAPGLRAEYELRLGEDRFRLAVAGDEIEVARGSAVRADTRVVAAYLGSAANETKMLADER